MGLSTSTAPTVMRDAGKALKAKPAGVIPYKMTAMHSRAAEQPAEPATSSASRPPISRYVPYKRGPIRKPEPPKPPSPEAQDDADNESSSSSSDDDSSDSSSSSSSSGMFG